MPTPIICAIPALCQFVAVFRPLFSKPQFKYFETVLLALMQVEDRRTLSGMQHKVVTGITLAGLSRFFSLAPWSEEALSRHWREGFDRQVQRSVAREHQRQREERPKQVGHPKATLVTGFLIMDDSTHPKPKGRKMRGLGRHHCTTYDKRVNGHSLFQGLYVLLDRRCPLMPQMYRTKSVCQKEGQAFQSKVELSVACVEGFEPLPGTHTHILVDSWYMNRRLWKACKQRGFALSGGLASNRKLRRITANGERYWQSRSTYAATLRAEDFTQVTWPSETGGHPMWVHTVRTLVHKLGACQVVCVKAQPDAPSAKTTFFVTSLLTGDAQSLVDILAVRWHIETFFGDIKELFGTDHYQMMSNRAIVRFWTLACSAYVFLEAQRAGRKSALERKVSIGQVRRDVQSAHRQNLLYWVFQQYQEGASPKQVQELLAA